METILLALLSFSFITMISIDTRKKRRNFLAQGKATNE